MLLPRGASVSPNIWGHPRVYEIENRAADPHGVIEEAMASHVSWEGRVFLDLGCGSGYHLPVWARTARRVIGVEPHPGLVAAARRRTGEDARIMVIAGTAQHIPIPDASVDVVQARWAYFFGPGCEPGLAELARVVRRGGTAMVIDNDPTRSTFGRWFRRGYPHLPAPEVIERFWSTRGWTRHPLDMGWRFERWDDFAAVVRIEFDPRTAAEILAERPRPRRDEPVEVDYAVNLWWRRW